MDQVTINGEKYTMAKLCILHQQYEIFCTVEYLIENLELQENEAIKKATEVRQMMDKYDFSEEEAIKEILGGL